MTTIHTNRDICPMDSRISTKERCSGCDYKLSSFYRRSNHKIKGFDEYIVNCEYK